MHARHCPAVAEHDVVALPQASSPSWSRYKVSPLSHTRSSLSSSQPLGSSAHSVLSCPVDSELSRSPSLGAASPQLADTAHSQLHQPSQARRRHRLDTLNTPCTSTD